MKLTANYFLNKAAAERVDVYDNFVQPDEALLAAMEAEEARTKAAALEAARAESTLRRGLPK